MLRFTLLISDLGRAIFSLARFEDLNSVLTFLIGEPDITETYYPSGSLSLDPTNELDVCI